MHEETIEQLADWGKELRARAERARDEGRVARQAARELLERRQTPDKKA
ncbi:MAG TPA: hypothetical protein VH583_06825 [Vicinamibacterales bacterium]